MGDMKIAIEAKASTRISRRHLSGLGSLIKEHSGVKKRIVVCLEPRLRLTDDGIEILPAADFVRMLWNGDLIS